MMISPSNIGASVTPKNHATKKCYKKLPFVSLFSNEVTTLAGTNFLVCDIFVHD